MSKDEEDLFPGLTEALREFAKKQKTKEPKNHKVTDGDSDA